MVQCVIRPVKLRNLFPHDNRLATSIARLCVLREDFYLETCGINEDSIKELDHNSIPWRRLYFFRLSFRTLLEIRSAIETLNCEAEFKELLSKQAAPERKTFQQLNKRLTEAHKLMKELGNKIGAHVQHEDVRKALEEMEHGREGMLEVGHVLKDVHYKFAGELVLDIMKPGTPEREHKKAFENDVKIVAKLIPVLELVDKIVLWYLVDRRLI